MEIPRDCSKVTPRYLISSANGTSIPMGTGGFSTLSTDFLVNAMTVEENIVSSLEIEESYTIAF